jgi:ABC-2 type transport system ATP-binding protein
VTAAVDVDNLTVRFGDFTAVDRVSFSVRRGEIFGFLGANGAGKTTTIRVLCGLLNPDEGRVRVAGIALEDGLDKIKSHVGYMSQKFTLYNDLTVEENLSFAAALRRIPTEEFRAREKELMAFIGFSESSKLLVKDLPGGIKQEVSLAAALLHDPDVVFLDEPTAGVSPAARARFWALIRKLSERGKTIFVTTHYLDEAEACGRIGLMRAGRLIALDTPERLKADAFPEPILEFEPTEKFTADWRETLARNPAVNSLHPHGRRFHMAVKTEDAGRAMITTLDASTTIRRIAPSLEDVFLRLVEGGPR